MKAKIQYVLVCVALLGLLQFGHATQWTLPWPSPAATSSDTPRSPPQTEFAPPPTVDAADAPAADAVTIDDDQLRKSGVALHQVGRRPMNHTLTVHGVVEYNRNLVAQLSSRVPGIVWRVERQAGESIRKGDVLAIIDAIEVGKAKAELLQAIVASDLQRSTVERMRSAGPALAERLLREAEAELRQAEIRVRNLVQTLVNLGLPVEIETLRALNDEQRARKLQFLGLPESLAATLNPAATTDNLIPLIAPFDGVVIGREITIGESVAPGDAHFVIADVSRMWVTLDVRKEDASQVRLGQEVSFTADGVAGRLTGRVQWISTQVKEETRTLQVRTEVSNIPLAVDADGNREQRMLRANTFGTGVITVRRDPVATVVPNEALHFDGREYFVFERDGRTFQRRVVTPGIVDGQFTEICSGISEGATIAAAGSHLVKSEFSLASTTP
ncbi:MAG: efflux RND transporter periplasmic adaptor subunit [Pirellulales bacterium]